MARVHVSLIQSDYGRSRHGNFEAAIAHGGELWHWFRDNSRNDFGLRVRGPRITGDHDNVAGAGCIIQSDYGTGPYRNFEVIAPLQLNDGAIELRHFFHDNHDVRLPWAKAQFITQSCAGPGGITDCFDTLEPHPRLADRAQKIVQLTGEFDREGWNGTGTPKFAFNRTESRFGIIGTDLGSSFGHQDRLYFLFGDTWRVGHDIPNDDLDSIAFCTDQTVDSGLELTFLSKPPLVPGIAQDGFDVPLDGVSWNDGMYVFFSTDRRQAGIYALMGRSILARSDNKGLDFTFLYEVSRYKFVHVSTMIVDAAEHGLPGTGPQLVVFGSGRYRSSDVYLAVKPAATILQPGGFRFYAGGLDQPQWSAAEGDAVPLFGEGCVGELSVRWNPLLGAWTCLYNADWPADRASVGGVVMRWSKRPYGRWSKGDIAFSVDDGLGKFMHLPNADHTQDGFGADRSAALAGMYGPYQIPQYARATDHGVQIYFTMSTWNPYQVMLMTLGIPTPLQ